MDAPSCPTRHAFAGVRPGWLLALALAGACPAPARGDDGLHFQEGIARSLEGGRLLYREEHWLRVQGGRPLERLVLYRCPDGNAFARKRVDYRGAPLAPAFALEDARTGYREGLRRAPAPVVYVRESRSTREVSRVLAPTGLVADAGFDEFVHVHWDALAAGRPRGLGFAVPARLRRMPFTLQRSGATTVGGERAHVFRLRLDGWLGAFAPRIDVSYGERSRRLLRFEGLTNLRDGGGRGQWQARIDFPQAARAVAAAGWDQAGTLPLSACGSGRRADAADTPDAAGSSAK